MANRSKILIFGFRNFEIDLSSFPMIIGPEGVSINKLFSF